MAAATLTWVRRGAASGWGGGLLTISALAVVVPMLLAVHWAAGTNLGW